MKTTNRHRLAIILLLAMIQLGACQNKRGGSDRAWFFAEPFPYLDRAKSFQISSYDTTGGNNDRINIHADSTVTIANIQGEGMISRMWFTIDSRDPHFLRHILLRIYWDDEASPSVEVPIGDFFGSGFDYRHHLPRYVGMSSGGYYCYFPMPFKKGARIEIANETGEEVYAFYYQINYYALEKGTLPTDTDYFHAYWNRDIRTDYPENYVALEAEGDGFFVGLNFNGQPYNRSLFYLEGDEMIFVDGETRPSVYGTGLEDYFTSGWYFQDGEFSALYHGLTLLDTENGRVTAYRHHIPDAIPFKESISVTLEHGHGNKEAADFSTTVFWYQREPHAPFPVMKGPGQRTPLTRLIPNNAIAPSALKVKPPGKAQVEDVGHLGPDWLDNEQLVSKDDAFTLVLKDLEEAAYEVDIFMSQGPDFGTISILHQDKPLASFHGYADKLSPKGKIGLGTLSPDEEGKLEIRFEAEKGTSGKTGAGIDAFVLTPKREYVPEWYLIGPFPNPRLSDYQRFGLDSAYSPEKSTALDKTHVGIDGQRLKWFKVSDGKGGYDMGLWQYFDPYEFIIIYAHTYIYSPEEQSVKMFIGSDDGSKVFLNDQMIYRFLDVRIAAPDQDEVEVTLKKGWNKLLVKAENNFGGFAFYLRFSDPLNNLHYSADKKPPL